MKNKEAWNDFSEVKNLFLSKSQFVFSKELQLSVPTDCEWQSPALQTESQINEKFLWLAVSSALGERLKQTGDLRDRTAGKMDVFGAGLYFFTDAARAIRYATPERLGNQPEPVFSLFLCRVLLGHPFQTQQCFPEVSQITDIPPVKKHVIEHLYNFDLPKYTSVACVQDHQETRPSFQSAHLPDYVVYDSLFCYPQFLISFVQK